MIAATACADRPGLWAWVEPFTKAGEPQSVPLPVSPESGLEQTEPIVLSGDSGSGWLVWLEAGAFDQDRRTARARHLDSAGEPIGETVSLSEVGVARAGLVGTHLVAAPLPGGGLVAAWRAQPDRRISLRFRTFDERGRPATPPTDLGVALVSGPEPFWIVTDDAGRITLLWWARDEGGSGRLFAASYSVDAKPRAGPAPLTGAPVKHWPQIAAVGTSGGRQLIAWADVDPGSGEPRIGLRRWSPELGPLGLTSWIDGSVARSWPFLKLLPGDAGGSFTLYWKETLDDAMEGRIAVLHWRDLRVGQ